MTAARAARAGTADAPRRPSPVLPGDLHAAIEALDLPAGLSVDLRRFAAELCAWGDRRSAARWLDTVARVATAERSVEPASTALTAAVAANLFKLIAYKDEYEVARLMTDADGLSAVAEVAGPGDRVSWQLHPPLLRGLGLDHKIAVGTWAAPAVRLLARGKALRGTPLDPFRWAEVRKVERALAAEYGAAVDELIRFLDADRLEQAVAIASLPDQVRGYEDIKLASVQRYRAELAARLERYRR